MNSPYLKHWSEKILEFSPKSILAPSYLVNNNQTILVLIGVDLVIPSEMVLALLQLNVLKKEALHPDLVLEGKLILNKKIFLEYNFFLTILKLGLEFAVFLWHQLVVQQWMWIVLTSKIQDFLLLLLQPQAVLTQSTNVTHVSNK